MAALGAQKVEYSAAESGLQGDLAQVRRVRETAKQARTITWQIGAVTRDNQDDTRGSLDEASTHMGELSEVAMLCARPIRNVGWGLKSEL